MVSINSKKKELIGNLFRDKKMYIKNYDANRDESAEEQCHVFAS